VGLLMMLNAARRSYPEHNPPQTCGGGRAEQHNLAAAAAVVAVVAVAVAVAVVAAAVRFLPATLPRPPQSSSQPKERERKKEREKLANGRPDTLQREEVCPAGRNVRLVLVLGGVLIVVPKDRRWVQRSVKVGAVPGWCGAVDNTPHGITTAQGHRGSTPRTRSCISHRASSDT